MLVFFQNNYYSRYLWGQRLGADKDQIYKITNCIKTT